MKKIAVLLIIVVTITCCKKDEFEPDASFDSRVTPYKIIDETFRVGSRISLAGNENRVVRSVSLPRRALYWCYWIGVGDEPLTELAKIVIPAAAAKYTSDPVVAYGWKFISALNSIQLTSGNVDLLFCDRQNKDLFENGDPNFEPYQFFQCPQTITSFAIRETMDAPILRDSTFYATFKNDSWTNGEDVTFKVWAYVIKE